VAVAKAPIGWWQSHRNLGFWGTVVAGVVLAGALWILGLVPVERWAAGLWGALSYPIRVPLVLLVALVGTLIVVALRALLGATAPPPPPWLAYIEDNFLGIVWRWSYDGTHIARWSLRPYCPRCSTGLRAEQHGYMDMTTTFICDECRFVQEVQGNGDAVLDRICRLIEREANSRVTRPFPQD
jgi:hypothetical protein